MLLKRKRSANILSSPTSDSSTNTAGHMQSFYPPTKPILSPFHNASKDLDDTPFHLSTRTRKRHRDNRPDASTVHGASSSAGSCWLGAVIQMSALADVSRVAASTIQRLYQAQQQQQRLSEPMNRQHSQGQQQQQPTATTQQHLPQKSTLHSFWRIEQPVPVIAPQTQYTNETSQEAQCEDCDGALKSEDAMDVDTVSVEDKACSSCRRPICDGCAVYGRERVCGACAGCERGW